MAYSSDKFEIVNENTVSKRVIDELYTAYCRLFSSFS